MDNVYLDERIYCYPDLENSAHWSVPNPYGTIGMVMNYFNYIGIIN